MQKKVFIPSDRLVVLKEYTDPDEFTIGVEKNSPVGGGYAHIQTENMNFEVEDDEVNLSSFKKQSELAPDIWKDEDALNSRVRLKLLDIVSDFWDYVGLSWIDPKAILLTGSICNYNWSKLSDIDVHIVVDFKDVDDRTDFVQYYFDSKKNQWNESHQHLTIFGFNVEMYVQDVTNDGVFGGIYDLEENKWIKRPSKSSITSIDLDKYEIKHLAAKIMTKIDDLHDELSVTSDTHITEEIGEKANKLQKKIKDLRKKGLDRGGESDMYNIVYKCLRKTGYLDKLWEIINDSYDKTNTIKESIQKYLQCLTEEVVADGNAEHNMYAKHWKQEREDLKKFILHFGKLMTSKENGKQYMIYYDQSMSELVGNCYCVCVQYNPLTRKANGTIYIRALDKFTDRYFTPQYDTRGRDNKSGTSDDIIVPN